MKLRPVAFALISVWLLIGLVSSASALMAGGRALVSRVRSDMRSTATALEVYRADHGVYPHSTGSPEFILEQRWLTTPMAYLAFDFTDVFKTRVCRRTDRLMVAVLHTGPYIAAVVLCATLLVLHLLSGLLQSHGVRPWILSSLSTAKKVLGVLIALVILMELIQPEDHGGPQWTWIAPNHAWTSDHLGFNYFADPSEGWILQSNGPNGTRDLEDLSSIPLASEQGEITEFLKPFSFDPTNGIQSDGDLFRVSDLGK